MLPHDGPESQDAVWTTDPEAIVDIPNLSTSPHHLYVVAPPYERLHPISMGWRPEGLPPRGEAILWTLRDNGQRSEFRWLSERPHGVPLIVVLPPPEGLHRASELVWHLRALKPRGVLPFAHLDIANAIRSILGQRPSNLGRTVSRYLQDRGRIISARLVDDVARIIELAPEVRSVTTLAGRLYASRRTLGRRFAAGGLPAPSHVLQFARLLHVTLAVQRDRKITVSRVASRYGYPDGFTMSNQMKRVIGCRPSELRGRLGWEWVVECWLHQEYGSSSSPS